VTRHVRIRYAVYVLYSYKCTNADAAGEQEKAERERKRAEYQAVLDAERKIREVFYYSVYACFTGTLLVQKYELSIRRSSTLSARSERCTHIHTHTHNTHTHTHTHTQCMLALLVLYWCVCLLYWCFTCWYFTGTTLLTYGARTSRRRRQQQRRGRYSVFLLYWYKSTHTDTPAAGACGAPAGAR
jgi:uncharacterized UBP type Zn finger protein